MHARPDCPVLPDIDKVMINLKTEEFVLDMNTLQALQQLLQWVGDFVLYLLASLPNQVRGRPPEAPPPGFTSLAPPLPGRFSVPLAPSCRFRCRGNASLPPGTAVGTLVSDQVAGVPAASDPTPLACGRGLVCCYARPQKGCSMGVFLGTADTRARSSSGGLSGHWGGVSSSPDPATLLL